MKVILVGGFIETIELCEDHGYEIVGIIDNNKTTDKYIYLGSDENAKGLYKDYKECKIVISPDKPDLRKALADYYKNIGFSIASLISEKATISKYAFLGKAVTICNHVNISAKTSIGNFVRVNVCANIMHDCKVEDFTTIAPNAVLLGGVQVGQLCYIGANATILPKVKLGDGCVIGAGAVVTKNINKGAIVKGVPAK